MAFVQTSIIAIGLLAIAGFLFAAMNARPDSPPPTDQAPKASGYAPVNGLNMYYEVRGNGMPAVFIHPFVAHSGLIHGLSRNRQWIVMDLQGHGRTADIDRPLTCEQHADDVAALLKYLKIDKADFCGDSFGGAIAVMMAVRHPELVRKIVSHGGSLLAFPANSSDRPVPDADFIKWQREEYRKIAPDPARWPTLFAKVIESGATWRGFSLEEFKAIQVPVLIVGGDHDIIPVERFAEWAQILPRAQLAITPNASHFTLLSEPERVMPTIASFLDEPDNQLPLGTAQTGIFPGESR